MRRLLPPAFALALLAGCTPKAGDRQTATDNPPSSETAMTADTMAPAGPGAGMATPAGMLSEIQTTNVMEVALTKKAQSMAKSPAVKQIAAKLASDHAKNHTELDALAKKKNLTLTASADTSTPPDLTGKTGADFDRAFVQHEIEDHQKNIDKLQSDLIPAATDAEIKGFLQKTLTALQGHLTSLQQTEKKLGSM